MSGDLDTCPNCGAPGNSSAVTAAYMAGKPLHSACASCHGQVPGSRSEQFQSGIAHARAMEYDPHAELVGGMTADEQYRQDRMDYDG